MEKKKSKARVSEKLSFLNSKTFDFSADEKVADIRVGISIADEKAERELNKRKKEAPLSTEEKIFFNGKL